MQLDPLTDDYPELTPYQYASCDPIGNVDVDGLEGAVATAGTLVNGGSLLVSAADAASSVSTHVIATVTFKIAPRAAPSALSITGSFLKGIGQSLLGTVVAVGNAVIHPVNTVSAIAHAVVHPIQTAKAIGHAISSTYTEFKNGDADTRANILGHATGEIAQLFLGVGEAKAATEIVEGAEGGEDREVGGGGKNCRNCY